MIVPTIATIVVGTAGLAGNISRANDSDRTRVLATLSADAGGVIQELQNERAIAARLLGKVDNDAAAAYVKQTPVTDKAIKAYTTHRAALASVNPAFGDQLVRLDQQLADLPKFRAQIVKGGPDVSFVPAVFRYQVLITDLLSLRDSSSQETGDQELGTDMRAAAAVASTKEFLSQERVVVIHALAQGTMTPALKRDFIGDQTGQVQNLATFARLATPSQKATYDQTVTGSDLRESIKYEGAVESLNGEDPRTIFTPQQWDAAMAGRSNLIRKVENEIDKHVILESTDRRDKLQRQVLIDTGLLLSMLLLSVLFAWMVARSMARSLRELRHGALTVAQYGLPQAVARLRDPTLASQMSADQLAAQLAEPLPVRSSDEFGQVAEAFNAVHLEAVRTAAEQAALRASVAQMFVNLARRSQILVDRLIGHLDRLERGEEDPDQLAELFQLDHLATRMRRNDENLLVLAGADSSRIQRDPAPLSDVLRASQSEVEHYTRLEFGMIDRDVEIQAHAVNDMVHMIAELLENATAFSPPDSPVVVEARRVGDRAVLLVEDRGIGISPDQMAELNERLANPPMVDVAVSRMMGLVVVARLAVRHGVKVELRPARERGTIADVTLPPGILVPRALAGAAGSGTPVREALGRANTPAPFGPPTTGPDRGHAPARAQSAGGFQSTGVGAAGAGSFRGGPSGTHNQPAWSDLVGANGSDVRPPARPQAQPNANDGLPQRQFTEQWPNEDGGWTDDSPAVSRQRPVDPVRPPVARPEDVTAQARVTPQAPPPRVTPPTPAPPPRVTPLTPPPRVTPPTPPARATSPALPAWPPVPEPTTEAYEPPPVPQAFAAALDMTAEIPRIREPEAAQPQAHAGANGSNGDSGRRFVDSTMELPIFREVESAWFRSRKPEPDAAAAPPPVREPAARPAEVREPAQPPAERRPLTERIPERSRPSAAPVEPPAPVPVRAAAASSSWDTEADSGWRAAQALAEEREFVTTETGLPKRVPMTQLVPGGVEKSTVSANRRTPESVRGLLSAYHRGVQRGRTNTANDDKTPEHTTAGPQKSQGGKEQQA